MRSGLKSLLFVSAFSPSLISVGVARLLSEVMLWSGIYYVTAGLMGTLCVIYILSALKWHGEEFPFQAKKIESNDALLFGVVFSYIVPFFVRAADLTLGIVVALIAIVWILFWITDAPIPSPLMRLLGFRFYKAESANGMVYTLITTKQINDPADVKFVKRVSAHMLMEVGR